jgi:peptidoglycan hydrolase-like protein with peptidoglycan-binding domain
MLPGSSAASFQIARVTVLLAVASVLVALTSAPSRAATWSELGTPVTRQANATTGEFRIAARNDVEIESTESNSGWFVRLVSQIQRRLTAIGLYQGTTDGRLDLETAAAIRDYEKSVSLPISGEATQDLLIHLESSAGKAQELVHSLEETRREQMKEAREALDESFGEGWSEGRDLAALPKPDNATTPVEATALCFAQPTPSCLLSEALASVPRIERADFRDWALSEIVVSQAAISPLDTAIAAALKIEDPRSIVTALGSIALSLVESGRLDEALATAARIPEGAVRADSYSDIAVAQAHSGDIEAAIETIARIDKPESRVPVLTAMAQAELEHGDSTAAYANLDEAVAQARTIRIAKHRNWALAGLALAQFEAGDDTGADDTLVLIEDAAGLATAYANLARVHAKADEMRHTDVLLSDAHALIETIGDRADRFQVLSRIAIAEAETGDFESAYETIENIEFGYAHTYTLSVVAIVQAAAGEIEPALGLVAGISDDRLRVQTLWTVATVSASRGEGERAATLRHQALAAARGITNTVDRLFILTDLARATARDGDLTGAHKILHEVLDVLKPIENAWARARVLSKAAATLVAFDRF